LWKSMQNIWMVTSEKFIFFRFAGLWNSNI
jgi:hypothetical protein